MTAYDEKPPLFPVETTRIPRESWRVAGIETLPPGWINLRIWSYDETLGCDLYETDECPGVLHFESTVSETVVQYADPDGELFDEFGEPFDRYPVVKSVDVADPPHTYREFADPTWQPAYLGGGYIGTCPVDLIRETLAQHGFEDAVPRPAE